MKKVSFNDIVEVRYINSIDKDIVSTNSLENTKRYKIFKFSLYVLLIISAIFVIYILKNNIYS